MARFEQNLSLEKRRPLLVLEPWYRPLPRVLLAAVVFALLMAVVGLPVWSSVVHVLREAGMFAGHHRIEIGAFSCLLAAAFAWPRLREEIG